MLEARLGILLDAKVTCLSQPAVDLFHLKRFASTGAEHARSTVTTRPFLCALSRDKVTDAVTEAVCTSVYLET
jgi:hypothetical protein